MAFLDSVWGIIGINFCRGVLKRQKIRLMLYVVFGTREIRGNEKGIGRRGGLRRAC